MDIVTVSQAPAAREARAAAVWDILMQEAYYLARRYEVTPVLRSLMVEDHFITMVDRQKLREEHAPNPVPMTTEVEW